MLVLHKKKDGLKFKDVYHQCTIQNLGILFSFCFIIMHCSRIIFFKPENPAQKNKTVDKR